MIGFDYGTSNCAMGVMSEGEPQILTLGDHGRYMASSLYAPSRELIVNWLENALTGQQKIDFTASVKGLLQRGKAAINELELDGINTDLSFGKAALARYLEEPSEGFYIKSPKSFLGTSGLVPAQIAFFENVVAAMMAHVKQLSEYQLQKSVSQVVIGRPINFQGVRGEESNKQAIDVLINAAKKVGYTDIEFQYEPVAAGFEFEATLEKETRVLVVDIGGGTSDCSMLLMGPALLQKLDRSAHLLGHSGKRIGGNDFDIQLALKGVMPNLGMGSQQKSGIPVPVSSYYDAAAINNVNSQTEFYSEENGRFLTQLKRDAEKPELISRLITVFEEKLSYKLVNGAEQAKIALSERDQLDIPLGYLDNNLSQSVDRQTLLSASNRELIGIAELMKEAVKQSNCKPDVIFVTGGTAKSPVISEFLRSQFDNTPIIIGDHFGSVTAGLARWSERIFK